MPRRSANIPLGGHLLYPDSLGEGFWYYLTTMTFFEDCGEIPSNHQGEVPGWPVKSLRLKKTREISHRLSLSARLWSAAMHRTIIYLMFLK